jgi:hypothetical protein
MKVRSSVMGTVAIRMTNDEVGPKRGVLQKDLVDYVGELYKFNVRPTISPGMPVEANPILQFQSGEFVSEEGKIPIMQLLIFREGDAIIAQDTELADAIMTDYQAQLDKGLGFRFSEARPARLYASFLVADFDSAFVEKTATFLAVEKVIGAAIRGGNHPYKLKRLSFGPDATTEGPMLTTLDQLVPEDFTIERRAGEPFAKNRFFCRAPLTRKEHERALEMVERAVIRGGH